MKPTINNVLCPVDLSENSFAAIDLATTLAQANDAKLIFLYVAMPELPKSSGHAAVEVETAIEDEKKKFDEIRPSNESVDYEGIFIRGNPMDDIVRIADENQSDLIVMSTHGRTGLSRLLLGSVAEHVIRHAPCPVLSLKTPNKVVA